MAEEQGEDGKPPKKSKKKKKAAAKPAEPSAKASGAEDGKKSGAENEDAVPDPDLPRPRRRRKPPPSARLAARITRWRRSFFEILRSAGSSDRPTRRMAWLYLTSLAALILVLTMAWGPLSSRLEESAGNGQATSEGLTSFFERRKSLADARLITTDLGKFVIELRKPPEGTPGETHPGVVHMAELEISVACDTEETCEFIEKHKTRARDAVAEAFIGLDREAVLSLNGKKRLRTELVKRLNFWLKRDSVTEVFFVHLVVA